MPEGLPVTYGYDAGPLLDGTARDAYRRRLVEVEEDIDEPDPFSNIHWVTIPLVH